MKCSLRIHRGLWEGTLGTKNIINVTHVTTSLVSSKDDLNPYRYKNQL